MKLLLVCVLVLVSQTAAGDSADWGYNLGPGIIPPARWVTKWPDCGGQNQSPLRVDPDTCQEITNKHPLSYRGFDVKQTFTVKNTGREITYRPVNKKSVSVDNSEGLRFYLHEIVLRYGKMVNQGSGHQTASETYGMELEFQFYPSSSSSYKDALEGGKRLLSTSVLYEQSKYKLLSRPAALLAGALQVPKPGKLEKVDLVLERLLPQRRKNFMSFYKGSLTRPPCSEQVDWYVYQNSAYYGWDQLRALRAQIQANGGRLMQDNYRSVQRLNDRTITCN